MLRFRLWAFEWWWLVVFLFAPRHLTQLTPRLWSLVAKFGERERTKVG